MARYKVHPAQGGGKYHDEKFYKDRRPTLEQNKAKQQLKKLQKKRRKR